MKNWCYKLMSVNIFSFLIYINTCAREADHKKKSIGVTLPSKLVIIKPLNVKIREEALKTLVIVGTFIIIISIVTGSIFYLVQYINDKRSSY